MFVSLSFDDANIRKLSELASFSKKIFNYFSKYIPIDKVYSDLLPKDKLEIIEQLKHIFRTVIDENKDFSNVTEDTNIIKDLGVNSVGLIYLLMAIEETYDIDMSDVTFSTFEKIKDVIKYIQEATK